MKKSDVSAFSLKNGEECTLLARKVRKWEYKHHVLMYPNMNTACKSFFSGQWKCFIYILPHKKR